MGVRQKPPHDVFCARLRQARLAAGISQKELGIRAGLDEFVASARINRYEVGVHQPDWDTVGRLAEALGIPMPYLFAGDDLLADLIGAFSTASNAKRRRALKALKESSAD